MKFMILIFTAMALPVFALSIDLGYDYVSITSSNQVEKGLSHLFSVSNIDLGSAVITSIQNIPVVRSKNLTHAQAQLVIPDDGPSVMRIPVQITQQQLTFTLRKDLWRRSQLLLLVEGRSLPNKSNRGVMFDIDIPSYRLISAHEFLNSFPPQHASRKRPLFMVFFAAGSILALGSVVILLVHRKTRTTPPTSDGVPATPVDIGHGT